ncbi:MAG TPA: NYN domain-containing protein [Rhizobiales bacterium]|nr:NYN domain-containing protein [Hyphomicrobiales bacterium]
MHLYQNERVGLFIDGANLHASLKHLDFDIDYKKLLSFFRDNSQLVRAFYYTAIADDPEYSGIKPLIDWLAYNGYVLVSKQAKEFVDGKGRKILKGNMDIEIAVDVLAMAGRLDHVVLFTGDGDFRVLVEAVQKAGCRVSAISTSKSRPPMVADELRRQVDQFIELADLESEIGKSRQKNYKGKDYVDV